VNTDPKKPISTGAGTSRRSSIHWPIKILAVLLLIIIIWPVMTSILDKNPRHDENVPLFTVRRGPLTISVTETGTINNREKMVIKSEVEGKTTILFLVSEGSHVGKGELLIQLDASRLEEEKTQQQIALLNTEAAYIHARENLAVTQSQVESDVAKASLEYEFAKTDLNKYVKGEYPQELQQAEAKITIAREEFQRTEEKLEWSRRLHGEGHITRTELEADALAAKRKKLEVELAKSNLKLLKDYTHKRKLDELESDREQAQKALARIKRKAAADNIRAEAELKAKKSEFTRQQGQLDKINGKIAKCRITAPVGGMVVYATSSRVRWRGQDEPLQEGQEVREGQELIHLPTTSSMMAEVKIHESSLMKVRRDLLVSIIVDALPGKRFTGRVIRIALLPDATSAWINPDLKVYSTEIYLDGDGSSLRSGMTCRCEIIVEEYADAVYVPLQSVVRVGGRPVVYVSDVDYGAKTAAVQSRPVEIGLDNNRMIRIVNGLSEGEKVLLAPPLAPSEAPFGRKRQVGRIDKFSGPPPPKE
jgi:HlyD family secretion protein